MENLRGRVAVVTGAASGIGLAVVETFLAQGMRVAMVDRDEAGLHAHAARLRNEGASVLPYLADVTNQDEIEGSAAAAMEEFGALHVAVNNAGIVNGGYSWELALEEWHRVIDVDLWGVIHGIRAYVPRILATGEEGHVVNVASMAAVSPLARLGPYSVSKHGVLGLTDVLAAEVTDLGAPVGASVVMPGAIKTAMNPIGTIEASTVADHVVDAILHNRRYVFTDDHSTTQVSERLGAMVTAKRSVA
jgi:NAD(P)-dependent dehydrogenase (short-subunit alcohol dehydrogenase family)